MKNLDQLIREFETNKINKVSIFISKMFDGAYQLKDGYEKPENDFIIKWEDPDEIYEYGLHFGHEYKESKPFFGPFFYIAVEQELDVNWFINKIKEYVEKENGTFDYFIDFLVNEHDIHLTSELGLIGDVEEVSRSETFILTDGYINSNRDRKKYESDIDFAVCIEARELDYLFFINEKPLIFSDLDNNISSSSNNETEYQIIKYYYDNGNLKEEYETLDGVKHGYYKLYHDNGQLKVLLHCEKGIQVDENIDSFDLNGKLVRKAEIKNGLLNGFFKEYYPSGKIKREGVYKDGEIFGIPKEYLEDGRIQNSLKNFEENKLIYLKNIEGIRLNWIYGVDEAYDILTLDKQFQTHNIPLYWKDNEDDIEVIFIKTINKEIAFLLIDQIIDENGGEVLFKPIQNIENWEYLHEGDAFHIGYLTNNECVRVNKPNFKFENFLGEKVEYGISSYDKKLRNSIKGLGKILYNIGEGSNNGKLCIDGKNIFTFIDSLEEAVGIFQNIVSNYNISHEVFLLTNEELWEIINQDGLEFVDDDFRLLLIRESISFKFYIYLLDDFFDENKFL